MVRGTKSDFSMKGSKYFTNFIKLVLLLLLANTILIYSIPLQATPHLLSPGSIFQAEAKTRNTKKSINFSLTEQIVKKLLEQEGLMSELTIWLLEILQKQSLYQLAEEYFKEKKSAPGLMVKDFDDSVTDKIEEIKNELESADVVITIPIYNEISDIAQEFGVSLPGTHGQKIDVRDLISDIKKSAEQYLSRINGQKALILLVGESKNELAKAVVKAVSDYAARNETKKIRIKVFGKEERFGGLTGKQWTLRASMRIAKVLNSNLVVIDGDMRADETWITKILTPIYEGKAAYVSPNYLRYYGKDDIPIISHLAYPLFSALSGKNTRMPNGGEFAVSIKMLDYFLAAKEIWEGRIAFEEQFAAATLAKEEVIKDVWLGEKIHKFNPIINHIDPYIDIAVSVMFEQVANHPEWWQAQANIAEIEQPVLDALPAQPVLDRKAREIISDGINRSEWINSFKKEYENYRVYYAKILSPKLILGLDRLYASPAAEFKFTSKEWAETVFTFLQYYLQTDKPSEKNKVPAYLKPLLIARIATFAFEVENLNFGEAEALLRKQAEDFARQKTKSRLWPNPEPAIKPEPETRRQIKDKLLGKIKEMAQEGTHIQDILKEIIRVLEQKEYFGIFSQKEQNLLLKEVLANFLPLLNNQQIQSLIQKAA